MNSIETIMNMNVQSIQQTQYQVLKEHAVSRLRKAADLLEKDEFIELDKMIMYSPAGDGYGCEDHYIYLGWNEKPTWADACRNIHEVMHKLLVLMSDIQKDTYVRPDKGQIVYDIYEEVIKQITSVRIQKDKLSLTFTGNDYSQELDCAEFARRFVVLKEASE